jgi:hypothetical protein
VRRNFLIAAAAAAAPHGLAEEFRAFLRTALRAADAR